MKKLKNILNGIRIKDSYCSEDTMIRGIETNSKKVKKGYLFIAVKGSFFDGNDYIAEAISNGAAAILTQEKPKNVQYVDHLVVVENMHSALAKVLNNFYPSLVKANIIGVTGTNGKTTVTFLLKSILEKSNYKCGIIGTLGWKISNGRINEMRNTTPGAVELAKIINAMLIKKVDYIIMEVSSHALSQNRVKHLNFKAAIFTNLSQDHLDYHKNMNNYLESKKQLFKKIRNGGLAILNIDDASYGSFRQTTKSRCISYGLSKNADCSASDLTLSIKGSAFTVNHFKKLIRIESKLSGVHNVYNILAAFSCSLELKCKIDAIKSSLYDIKNVPGRLEKLKGKNGEYIYIDYAHTPDALKNVTSLLSTVKKAESKLICLFGCGGDRDKKKRPKMGKIAVAACDIVIVSSDNPRSEDASDIINDIKKGIKRSELKKCYFIKDRLRAIRKAIKLANAGDVVLIAGKGHEKYQVIKDRIIPFSDYNVARKILNEK